jgi:[amino group carrier protein]-L-2-aminoadipate 6-kinase
MNEAGSTPRVFTLSDQKMTIVVKMGDRVIKSVLSESTLNDLAKITHQMPTVIVHGGGDTVTSIAEKLGIQQKFVTSPEGFRSRYTDSETIQVYTMVMAGKINKEIVRCLQSRKVPALGLSGLDGALIRAERKKNLIVKDERGRRRIVDGGYTGKVTQIDSSLLQTLLSAGYVPVIAPIALGSENESLNLDGDRTAAYVAGALRAELLLLLTDVEGVTLEGSVVPRLSAAEAKRKIPTLGPGMITKVYAALEALSMGVGRVTISSGHSENPFTTAIQGEAGTVIEQ